MKLNTKLVMGLSSAVLALNAGSAFATCADVSRTALQTQLTAATALTTTGGYNLPMWLTFVDESGKVCDVLTSGTAGAAASNHEWLGSRVISAQKANTANAFIINGYAISTANLYSAVQPGGSLFGLQLSNPVDPSVAYQGATSTFGTASDPLRNKRIGGINVFGGGLALYKKTSGSTKVKIGAIGVSGDTSCRDHAVAWNVRSLLTMHPDPTVTHGITTSNFNPDGTAPGYLAQPDYLAQNVTHSYTAYGDEMIFSNSNATSATTYWNAWAQPACPNSTSTTVETTANGILKIPSNP